MKIKNKTNKGITLIALIITIIVLIILAGVSIATLLGDDGILTKAKNAKNETLKGSVVEVCSLLDSEYIMKKNLESNPKKIEFLDIAKKLNETEESLTKKGYSLVDGKVKYNDETIYIFKRGRTVGETPYDQVKENIEEYYNYIEEGDGYRLEVKDEFMTAILNGENYLEWKNEEPLPNPGSFYGGKDVISYEGLFYKENCHGLEKAIIDLSKWDTSKVVTMENAFRYKKIELSESRATVRGSADSINITNWDTSNVTNMSGMFYEVYVQNLYGLSELNTANVTNMSSMFEFCDITDIEKIDLSNWDTTNVESMTKMFKHTGCTEWNLSNWNISKVKSMDNMFKSSRAIKLNLTNFNMPKGVNIDAMFDFHTWNNNEIDLDLTGADFSNVGSMANLFEEDKTGRIYIDYKSNINNIRNLVPTGMEIIEKEREYEVVKDNIETFYNYEEGDDGYSIGISNEFRKALNSQKEFEGWKPNTPLPNPGSVYNGKNVVSMSSMFEQCEVTNLDLTKWDTSNVEDMNYMFVACQKLASIKFDKLDTSKVKNMAGMFHLCESLESIDLYKSLDTSSVEDMTIMFNGCTNLKNINLRGIDISKLTNMTCMFYNCTSLESIDLEGIDTSKVDYMSNIFYNCTSLKNVYAKELDLSNLSGGEAMFENCTALEKIDLSGWKVGGRLFRLFSGCNSLNEIKLNDWKRTGESGLSGMFYECSAKILYFNNCELCDATSLSGTFAQSSFEKIDIYILNAPKLEACEKMFYGCHNLSEVKVDYLYASKLKNCASMFEDCTNLKKASLQNWQTPNLDVCVNMFDGNYYLDSVIFASCSSTKQIDCSQMFKNCYNLTFPFIVGLQYINTNTCGEMFKNCYVNPEVYISRSNSGIESIWPDIKWYYDD